MSNETNKQTAKELFATTAHDVLWANPKGEFFTSENIGALSLKPGQKLEKFERSKKVEKADDEVIEYELNAKDTIEKIKAVTSLEDLKAFETDERKSVKEAYAKKQTGLVALIEVDGNKDTEEKK